VTFLRIRPPPHDFFPPETRRRYVRLFGLFPRSLVLASPKLPLPKQMRTDGPCRLVAVASRQEPAAPASGVPSFISLVVFSLMADDFPAPFFPLTLRIGPHTSFWVGLLPVPGVECDFFLCCHPPEVSSSCVGLAALGFPSKPPLFEVVYSS